MEKYIVNINDVPVGKITGREVRDLINANTVGSEGITLRIVDVLPQATSFPGHIHTESEEVIFVLSGRGEIKIGEEVSPMKPGDAIWLPKGLKHLIRNVGKESMRLACSFSTCDFFRDMKNDETMKF
jgi:putative monooxygenase